MKKRRARLPQYSKSVKGVVSRGEMERDAPSHKIDSLKV